jgi:hypothetical protein
MKSKEVGCATPVLLLVFNRPELTRSLIGHLRPVRPQKLYIAADGPRANHVADAVNCPAVRAVLAQEIDWPCEVLTLYRSENLGCGKAVSGAINWFFEQVESGIILEDDCFPDPSFFDFCTDLLAKYAHEDRVKHISGNNFQLGRQRGEASYYFSQYPHIWGWASWRRAWAGYQFELPNLQNIRKTNPQLAAQLPMRMLREVQSGKLDTWDTQWLYHVVSTGGLCVTPQVNLVRNAGFSDGTHTLESPYYYAQMAFGQVHELVHPAQIMQDKTADAFANALLYNLTLANKLRDKWRKAFSFLNA